MKAASRASAGFTLAEIMLVLVVGAIVLGSATLLFGELRNNASAAVAQQRTAALQGLIETYLAAYPGTTPSYQWVADRWLASRQKDYDYSPWGGFAQCNTGATTFTDDGGVARPSQCLASPGGSTAYVGIRYIQIGGCTAGVNPPDQGSNSSSQIGDDGVLDYIQLTDTCYEYAAGGSETGSGYYLGVWDNALKAFSFSSLYAVAIEDQQGNQFSFVKGPGYCTSSGCAPPSTNGQPLAGRVVSGQDSQ